MRKHFLLALPLASLAFLAGCSCGSTTGDCATPAPVIDDCNECPTVATTATVSTGSYAVAEAAEIVYAEGAEIRHFCGGHRGYGYHRGHRGPRGYHGGQYRHGGFAPVQGIEHGAEGVVDAGIHGVEAVGHGVGNVFHGIGDALHITDATGGVQGSSNVYGEVMSAEQYLALIESGKVQDSDYRAPRGMMSASVEATETMASIPSRFDFAPAAPVVAAPAAIQASVSVEVAAAPAAVAPLPMPTIASAASSYAESYDASYDEDMPTVAASEMSISSDELTTPALMNAAALREANVVSAAVSVETSAPAAVGRIPAMPLPEGWGYIHEQDLGANVEAAAEPFFSDARSMVGSGSANDI